MAKTPWTRLNVAIDDYVDGYELRDCEDAEGRTGDYAPNEHEQMLISDAIEGLLGDEELLDLIVEAREFTKASRRAEGRCQTCGAPSPGHWGIRCRGATTAEST